MPAQLARHAYRRLLARRGSALPCLCLAVRPLSRLTARAHNAIVRQPPRRTFFGLFQRGPRALKSSELEPGYRSLFEFNNLEHEGHRLPPRGTLLKGFRDFFEHKLQYHKPLHSTQAALALGLFSYLADTSTNDATEELTLGDLRLARDALLRPPREPSIDHLELSQALYAVLLQRTLALPASSKPISASDRQKLVADGDPEDFKRYLTALTLYGGSSQAAGQLKEYWQILESSGRMYKGAKSLWIIVLRGLAKEGKEEELVREVERAQQLGVDYAPPLHEIMTTFFASRDRVEETKRWFEKPIYARWPPSPDTYLEVLRFSLRSNQEQWAKPIFQSLCDSNPTKALWDVIFQWAVLAMDKGVDDVKQMMETMMHHVPDRKPINIDNATINGLVRAAIEKNDPYLAERFIGLGKDMGIPPDAINYILQMDYRIDARDLSGAKVAYQELDSFLVPDDADLPVINKYIRALCAAQMPDTDHILELAEAVERRHVALEPESVVSLCILFLRNDQPFETIDILSIHTVQYSLEEREKIGQAFVAFCLNKKNSTARVWDAYTLLRQFFPETKPSDRIALMNAFFDRKRPDMACTAFGHMRGHKNPLQRPTTEVYVQMLEGLGRHPDKETLRTIHNMLKMDTNIQMPTKLLTALMIAYIGCDEPLVALQFWGDITASAEGPTYNSLAVVFRACEILPGGERWARKIWTKIQRMELEVPPEVFTAYCGAIAGQGHLEEAKTLILGMDSGVGYPPNLMTIGVTYNVLPNQDLQGDFEAWAAHEYPEIWARLKSIGRKANFDDMQKFRLVRDMKA